MENIVIATIKLWNIKNANYLKKQFKDKYNIFIIKDKNELNFNKLNKISPKYVFFPHWSWRIPENIYNNFNCIVFHMTDLPFGRGGTPLQNLIQRKIYNTKISAIAVGEEIDAGKIYCKRDLYIGIGSACEIFMCAAHIIFFDMIPFILENNPIPYQQKGNVVTFRRRTPDESDIASANIKNLEDLYDFIRMLDAEGYPKAFIKIDKFKFLFSESHKKVDKLVGRFEVIIDDK